MLSVREGPAEILKMYKYTYVSFLTLAVVRLATLLYHLVMNFS